MMPRSADYEVKLTPDHESLRHTIRDFAEKEIRPVAFEIDRNNKIPRDLLRRIAGVGLTAITYKEEYGGLGGDLLSMVIAIEEIARVSAACSTVFVASHFVSEPLNEWGSPEQKKRFLVLMVLGEKIGAHAVTEPGAGSDVAGSVVIGARHGPVGEVCGMTLVISNGVLP